MSRNIGSRSGRGGAVRSRVYNSRVLVPLMGVPPFACLPLPGAKETVAWADVATRVPALLEQIQSDMFKAAKERYDACLEKVRAMGVCNIEV